MAPTVRGLEQLYGEQVNFVVLDIDKTSADQYGPFMDALGYNSRIRPGLYLLDPDGNVIQVWAGYVDGTVLQQAIVNAIVNYP